MSETKKEPWLLVLLKGQIFNKDAEVLGRGPWVLFGAVVLISAILAAFPFVNDKFTSALRSTNPALYPGLDQVFDEVRTRGWDLEVVQGKLTTGPSVPPQAVLGGWKVVFEPAGGDGQALAQAVGDLTSRKIAFFGKTSFGLLDQTNNVQFDGTWSKLEGFRSADTVKIPSAKLIPLVLYASATGGLPQTILTILLLMFIQVVFLTVILGFLLSLSKIQILGTQIGAKRTVGFISSLKTTGFVTLGPALLICVGLSFLPGASGVSWVGFSALFGMRIVFIYMGRFRNKKKEA
jgi:hypothetical protein